MANKQILENSIEVLQLSTKLLSKLKNNNISTVNELWIMKRKDLKNINLSDAEINQIIVKLQLNGFDLNKKTY